MENTVERAIDFLRELQKRVDRPMNSVTEIFWAKVLVEYAERAFDWDKFAKDLEDKFGESLITAEDADENNPYDYWLQDVTVADIVEFCKNYR